MKSLRYRVANTYLLYCIYAVTRHRLVIVMVKFRNRFNAQGIHGNRCFRTFHLSVYVYPYTCIFVNMFV